MLVNVTINFVLAQKNAMLCKHSYLNQGLSLLLPCLVKNGEQSWGKYFHRLALAWKERTTILSKNEVLESNLVGTFNL
jgi:hypothetical protein